MEERRHVVQEKEDGYLIPQWLIAVIVIGLASLLFILIFGITVVSVTGLYFSITYIVKSPLLMIHDC